MATAIEFKITDAGIAAAFTAQSTGIDVELTHVAFGDGFKAPTGLETALVNEIQRVTIVGGARIKPDQVHINAVWLADANTTTIHEVGIYAGSTLFAYASNVAGTTLATKNSGIDFVFYYDWVLKEIPADTITIVLDPYSPAAMAALQVHMGDPLAHTQLLRRADVAQDASRLRWAGLAGGTANSIALTLPAESLLESYELGQDFRFIAMQGNSGPVSITVNGLGARSLRKEGATGLVAGDLKAGRVYDITYDGGNFQLSTGTGSGTDPIPEGQVFFVYPYIATASQTTFSAPYKIGALMVFVRGEFVPPERYTALDGANVILHAACTVGDEVSVVTIIATAEANVYLKPAIDALFAASDAALAAHIAAPDPHPQYLTQAELDANLIGMRARRYYYSGF